MTEITRITARCTSGFINIQQSPITPAVRTVSKALNVLLNFHYLVRGSPATRSFAHHSNIHTYQRAVPVGLSSCYSSTLRPWAETADPEAGHPCRMIIGALKIKWNVYTLSRDVKSVPTH